MLDKILSTPSYAIECSRACVHMNSNGWCRKTARFPDKKQCCSGFVLDTNFSDTKSTGHRRLKAK